MTIKNEESFLNKAISKKISRRSFIKWSAAIGATTTMSGLIAQSGMKVAGAASLSGCTGTGGDVDQWIGTRCLMCHSVCYLAVGVTQTNKDGRAAGLVRKIEGYGGQWKAGATTPANGTANGGVWDMSDDANYPPVGGVGSSGLGYANNATDQGRFNPLGEGYLPYSQHNRGRVCAKGNNGMEHVYDPDRVKYPLERSGPRGSGMFKKVSWGYALRKMANVLRERAGYTTFYDLNVEETSAGWAWNAAGKNTGITRAARGVDNRHRFIHFVGRNESDKGGAQFSSAYGTPNHIEHTSLCELSRHIAQRSIWGHHWSIPDITTHKAGTFNVPDWAAGTGTTTYFAGADNDCDLMIEIGGNPLEAKIPSASYSVHWGDRRKANLVGAVAGANTAKGRIIAIDVRQSNTMAFADEQFFIKSGSDGALALAMFRYLTDTVGTLKAELDAGHLGGKYVGLFTAEAGAAGTNSLQTYVGSTAFRDALIAGGASGATTTALNSILSAVETITGINTGDIVYLARALGGLDSNGSWNNGTSTWTGVSPAVTYKNVVLDGYRGPAMHSNGSYNYRALRALQIVAANKYADDVATAGTGRGGIAAFGALWADGHTKPDSYSSGNTGYGYAGVTISGSGTTGVRGHEIDLWDYEKGQERWRYVRGFKWNDQNLIPAMRYFFNLHPYKAATALPAGYKGPEVGSGATASSDWAANGGYAADYKPEVLLLWKNAPAYARPNVELDVETFTAQSGGAYLLEHMWSIDTYMGDGTRFADLILPDTTYLERYDYGDDFWYSVRNSQVLRQPVVQDRTQTLDGKIVPRHLFDARSIRAITYELARLIQPSDADVNPAGCWPAGGLYNNYKWITTANGIAAGNADLGSLTANAARRYVNDGEYAAEVWAKVAAAGIGAANATFTTGEKWMIGDYTTGQAGMGVAQHPMNQPEWWTGAWNGQQGTLAADSLGKNKLSGGSPQRSNAAGYAGKLQVYNPHLATYEDIDGNLFSGTPIYQPIAQQLDTEFPLRLTTYKLNIHTQSRTAGNPRQQEIIGSNWAMINPADADPLNINSGDTIRVTSAQGNIEIEAKVTPKAGVGHVHISHSAGHDSNSFGGDGKGGVDGYRVDGACNRLDAWTAPSAGVASQWPAKDAIDDYRNNRPPSAPRSEVSDGTADKIRGTHANRVITRWVDGVGQSTDPLGVGVAWFDTAVKIEKV